MRPRIFPQCSLCAVCLLRVEKQKCEKKKIKLIRGDVICSNGNKKQKGPKITGSGQTILENRVAFVKNASKWRWLGKRACWWLAVLFWNCLIG